MTPLERFVSAARTDTDATANTRQPSSTRVIGTWFWLHMFGTILKVVHQDVGIVRGHWTAKYDSEGLILRMNENSLCNFVANPLLYLVRKRALCFDGF